MTQAAVYYHPDGYRTDRKSLMGRHAAGEGFLKAFVRHVDLSEYACVAESQVHAREFAQVVHGLRPGAAARWLRPADASGISAIGTLALPGPELSSFAWRRRRASQRSYSLVGVTHTTATHKALDIIGDLCLAPVQPWDALVCTSKSVKAMVCSVLDDHEAYLADRIGANRFGRPRLPVIPLGVDVAEMQRARAARSAWRDRLGVAAGDVAVLYVGRLSLHGKAHPSPMFAALELAHAGLRARGVGQVIHLILCGWFASESQEKIFRSEAARLAPSIRVHLVDGRTPEARSGIWGAADLFTLLSDNIQETFGLAPIEAMAAGLPVVVSDWDGFRDTVEHGVQGFRAATSAPMPGYGRDLAHAYEDGAETYDGYMAAASQFCAVDVRQAAAAFEALIGDPGLRARMAEAAVRRARDAFDWSVVMAAYRELWAELAAIRAESDERAPPRPATDVHPLRGDPFRVFATWPASALTPDTRLRASGREGAVQALTIAGLAVRPAFLSPPQDIEAAMGRILASEGLAVREIVEAVEPARRRMLARTLSWLLKHDYLVVSDPAGGGSSQAGTT